MNKLYLTVGIMSGVSAVCFPVVRPLIFAGFSTISVAMAISKASTFLEDKFPNMSLSTSACLKIASHATTSALLWISAQKYGAVSGVMTSNTSLSIFAGTSAFILKFMSTCLYGSAVFSLICIPIGVAIQYYFIKILNLLTGIIDNETLVKVASKIADGQSITIRYKNIDFFSYPKHRPLAEAEVNKIAPLKSPALGNKLEKIDDCCAICLESIESKQLLRTLPCSHSFHSGCIDNWLLSSSPICPFCRAELKIQSE